MHFGIAVTSYAQHLKGPLNTSQLPTMVRLDLIMLCYFLLNRYAILVNFKFTAHIIGPAGIGQGKESRRHYKEFVFLMNGPHSHDFSVWLIPAVFVVWYHESWGWFVDRHRLESSCIIINELKRRALQMIPTEFRIELQSNWESMDKPLFPRTKASP